MFDCQRVLFQQLRLRKNKTIPGQKASDVLDKKVPAGSHMRIKIYRCIWMIIHLVSGILTIGTRPGKLTVRELENGPVEMVDLPTKNGDFP